jgi:hypothetical protein
VPHHFILQRQQYTTPAASTLDAQRQDIRYFANSALIAHLHRPTGLTPIEADEPEGRHRARSTTFASLAN